MPEENDNNSKAGITTPLGSLSFSGKRVSEFIAILSLSILGVIGYAFWDHKDDSKDIGNQMVIAVKEMTKAQLDNNREQRVMNCLISLEQKDRPSRLAECERIAR